MTKTKKMILSSSLLTMTAIATPLVAISCTTKETVTKITDLDNKQRDWDSEITLVNSWFNDGFRGTEVETNFLKKLETKFKELKNADEKTKNLPDVKFKINVADDKQQTLQNLQSSKLDTDVAVLNYSAFIEQVDTEAELAKFTPQLVAQTATLKFTWSDNGDSIYKDGSESDPLRLIAERENQLQFNAHGEFPTWSTNDPQLQWDGSKYAKFYYEPTASKNVTYMYHGAILISGNEEKRKQIIADWEAKDLDKFLSHGVIKGKDSSGGKYRYQVALLARHFDKSIDEIKTRLNNKTLVTQAGAGEQIGKVNSGLITKHIAFDDEGAFNWTAGDWAKGYYQPSAYIESEGKKYDSKTNDVVRVLTVTNPAPYDAVFARAGLSQIQINLISQALTSLSIEENTYGIYTGYNKFMPTSLENFKKFIQLQLLAENKEAYSENLIPEI